MAKLTKRDLEALDRYDDTYFEKMGELNYGDGTYDYANLYNSIAASLGNTKGMINNGYIYMYARLGKKNMDLAFINYKLAADANHPEALYKLATLYASGKEVEKNREIALYYYLSAMEVIRENRISPEYLGPLRLSLGIEKMPGGGLMEDVLGAYSLLIQAKKALEREMALGAGFREAQYKLCLTKLADPFFDAVKEVYEEDDSEILNYEFSEWITPFTNPYQNRGKKVVLTCDINTDVSLYDYTKSGEDIRIKEGTIGYINKEDEDFTYVDFLDENGEVYATVAIFFKNDIMEVE